MNTAQITSLTLICTTALAPCSLIWDGGGDNYSVFQEANWTDDSGVAGTDPPADTLNGATPVLYDCLIDGDINVGGGGGAGNHFDLGEGTSLTLNGGTSWLSATGYGIRGTSGGATESLLISTSGTIRTTLLADLQVTLASGTLELSESDNPLPAATVDFSPGSTGMLHLTAETTTDTLAEHLAKITIDGAAAVVGGNVTVASDGSNGTWIGLFSGNADSDLDGLSDDYEVNTSLSNPYQRDSDGDGTPDGLEIEQSLDPNNPEEFLDRPNIIFFIVDDLGYGDLGCFWQDQKSGTQKFDTPGIDTMAAEGAKLTHHYIAASVCAPSRASIMQGRHQGHADVRDNQFDKALANNHTISSVMQRAGYRTIHVGKSGIAGGEGSTDLTGDGSKNLGAHPLDRGFDEFFGYLFHGDGHEHYPQNGGTGKTAHIYNGYQQITNASSDLYTTDAWTAYAKNAITTEAQDGDNQPFFLYLAYDTPHFKMSRPMVEYPAGGGLTGGIQWTTDTDPDGNVKYASTCAGTSPVDDDNADDLGWEHPSVDPSWPLSNRKHVGMIRRIDSSIADILQLLKDLEIDDNTLCVFTSDNGPHNEGNDPRYFESFADMEGIKRDMWEAGIRVPTIIRWPGQIPDATGDEANIAEIDYPMAAWDWMPTFAEIAQVPAPAWCDGVSILPELTGTGTQRDKGYLYFEYQHTGSTPNWSVFPNHRGENHGEMQCLRIGDFMGVRTGISTADDDFQIYDVTNDPAQGTDLAPLMSTLQQEMKDLALQARRPGGGVSRPYDSDHVPAVTADVEAGLEFASYEGIWTYVPEFRDLTPASTGTVDGIDLSVRSRDDNVGLLFTGYILAPSAGTYTFYLASDSGSDLFIHDAHVIDDDFAHSGAEVSGSINLESGLHPVRIYYRHGIGSHALDLSWSGPGITREPVPDSSLRRDGVPGPVPIALADSATTHGEAVDIDVLANDSDDGLPDPPAALSIVSVGSPAAGTASAIGGLIRYTPDSGFYGTDSFSYTITDGDSFASAQVSVNVSYQADDLWIPLNECAGSSVYDAGGILLGSMSGFDDSDASRIGGMHGMAVAFDGTDDQVSLDGMPSGMLPVGDSPRTMMCWLRIQPGVANENQTMFGYGENTSGQRVSFRTSAGASNPANQKPRLEVQNGYIVGNTILDDGNWHHLAIVIDDFNGDGSVNVAETKIYVDGQIDSNPSDNADPLIDAGSSSSQVINTAANSTPVLGGSNHSANYNFAGDLDEFRVFPSALTTADIQALYSAANESSAAWHRRYLGTAAVDWSADLDEDGISRLGEYAFGGNPQINDAVQLQPSSHFNATTGRLETTFRRRSDGSHLLVYDVEQSRDLADWSTLSASEIGGSAVTLSAGECLEQVTFESDATSAEEPRQFLRVKVNFAP